MRNMWLQLFQRYARNFVFSNVRTPRSEKILRNSAWCLYYDYEFFCSLCFAFRLIVVRSLSGHIYNRRQYISHPNIINMWNTLHNDSRYIGESRWMKSLTDHKKMVSSFFMLLLLCDLVANLAGLAWFFRWTTGHEGIYCSRVEEREKKNDAEKTLTLTKIRKMKTKITQKIQLYHNRTEAQPRFPSRELAPKKTEALSQQYNWRILLFIMTWPTFREKNEGTSTPLVIIDHIILKLA